MATTVKLAAPALLGGTIQTQNSGTIQVQTDGTITVSVLDVPDMLRLGCAYVNNRNLWMPITAARAATAGRIVASASLSNGTLTIANQPDVGRQLGLRIDPGTSAISAGNIAINYTANDGTNTTDNLSAVTAASTPFTLNTSKGVLHLASAIVTGLTGGASPLVQINDTNALALSIDPGFVDLAITKENVDGADETIGTLQATAGCITPTTAPNGTHTYGFGYTYLAPDQ